MNITYEEFEKHMKQIVSSLELESKIDRAIYGSDVEFYYPTLIDSVIELLEMLCDDTTDHWISYWVYDLGCGEYYKPTDVEDKDGNSITLDSIESLWELLKTNSRNR